jgi:dipeptidyl aminopeptidase/acylaminoacyl peptidase
VGVLAGCQRRIVGNHPVLLIQGDDDRNVRFNRRWIWRRLRMHDVPFEELVIPNEIHGFLRSASWLRADEAAADYLARQLKTPAN